MHRPSAGLVALTGFFALGGIIASVTAIALLLPGTAWEPMWRLNPQAQPAFRAMGRWAITLMVVVATACMLTAFGLWVRARWGHRLALVLLAINLVGDVSNAVARGDRRILIGLPVAGALIAYLLSAKVRGQFEKPEAAA